MVKKFFKITAAIMTDLFFMIINVIGRNLRYMALIMNILLPYLMWYIGIDLYRTRGRFAVGGEILIPIFVFFLTYYLRQFANRIGKGERVPTPNKRFTTEDEDGEINIDTARLEELIVYMADLEDWLVRRGLLEDNKVIKKTLGQNRK